MSDDRRPDDTGPHELVLDVSARPRLGAARPHDDLLDVAAGLPLGGVVPHDDVLDVVARPRLGAARPRLGLRVHGTRIGENARPVADRVVAGEPAPGMAPMAPARRLGVRAALSTRPNDYVAPGDDDDEAVS